MRALLSVVAATVMLTLGIRSGHATEGPWCAWATIGKGSYSENCSMRSYEMCRQEITGGNRGSCYPNPRFHGDHGSVRSNRSRRY
jgi:Protein of unknown function (DUF3551)